MTLPDWLSVALRALSFVLLLQAAGAAFFAAMFGHWVTTSLEAIRGFGRMTALGAIAAVTGRYLLESARMAGEMSGLLDASLQSMVWASAQGAAFALQILGLLLLIAGFRHSARPRKPGGVVTLEFIGRDWAAFGLTALTVLGAMLIVGSFGIVGHAQASPRRWSLVPLLLTHVLIVAFWFGALWPLRLVALREPKPVIVRVIDSFSASALWLVPLILVAGAATAALLLPNLAALMQPYGQLLIAKAVLFAVLMGLAALNKWRFGPAIALGGDAAILRFRRSVMSEYGLIVVVLTITAVMTAFFSPEPP